MAGNHLRLGKKGEELATEYLRGHGYTILERNYTCYCGEIDIIARYKHTLIFIEVKTRSSDNFGHPAEAVTHRKQRKITQVAEHYLSTHDEGADGRFDVISVVLPKSHPPRVEHIANAFESHD